MDYSADFPCLKGLEKEINVETFFCWVTKKEKKMFVISLSPFDSEQQLMDLIEEDDRNDLNPFTLTTFGNELA